MRRYTCDVVVVGAGLSGLTAARLLHKHDLDVAVVEASGRVGGRACTLENPDLGMVSDQGAVRCGPPMSTLWQLIKDVGVKVWQQSPSQMVYITEDGVSRFNPTSLPTWNPLVRLDHHNVFSTMDRLANQIPPEEPWEALSAQEWDSCTMKDFFDRTVWFKSVRRITDAFVRAIACAEPEEVSMLWFLWLLGQTGGGRWATLVNPNPPQFRVSGGMQHLCKVLAEQLGDKVTLNCPITKVENVEDGALVTSKEATWEAKAVILAVPPPCYSKISLSPALPEAFHHITMGRVYRCTLYYKTNFWGNGDRFVQLFADYPGCLVVNAYDDTVPGNKYPAFTATVSGRNAIEARKMTKEQRKNAICKCLAKAFSSEEAMQPLHYEEKNWNEEEYIGGGFCGHFPPGVLTSNKTFGRCNPTAGRVFLAGAESATRGYGFLEGAVWAGKRSAEQVRSTTSSYISSYTLYIIVL
ncbi:PREDICTED: amine oxidase [flavin-containing] A-like isoform X1 [Branchiostoma belcheri]|uniref:Amine oxidase n=1 Tax=Branchiostoma belcheri TaxID=7741 RepID=A0A6P4ZB40_BRABE|nr:PREDICTED: amine oxidase [flavin-containing] A-like isoform X1 [Branchiostoma belcheri]